jgi:hypothetical protein
VYLLDTTTAIRALEMLDHLPYTPEVPSGSLDVRVWNRLLLDLARKGEAEPGRLDTLADQFVDPAIAPGWGALNIRMAWIGREAMGLLARMRRRGIPPVAEQAVMRREAEAWASRGAWDSALAAADREAVRFAGRTSYAGSPAAVSAYRTAVLAAWLQVGPAALAERRRAAALALLASDTSGADSAEVFWLDGLTAFSGKDARALDQARTRLRGVSGGSAGPLLGMLGALTLGLADRTRVAADSLASLVTTVQDTSELDWTPWHPYFHWVGRLTAAPLLRERGDNPRARQLLDAFDRVWASPEAWSASWALLSVAQREKGVAAAAMGDSVAARRAARWLLILYDMPPPPHRAWLDEARALLGRPAN